MQLVGMSNLKLNREMYSPRSQSMHRRIVIKNFLTMLYQRHPIEWIEDSPVDDKDHWMEQTLSAVGIEEHSDSHQVRKERAYFAVLCCMFVHVCVILCCLYSLNVGLVFTTER